MAGCTQSVVAIGDNNNDMQMIKAVGYGFAVENAVEALKAVAPLYHW